MKLPVEFEYEQAWKTKKHKTVRVYYLHSEIEVEIDEATEDMFPLVASVIRKEEDGSWSTTKEIRHFNAKLWIPTTIPITELHSRIECPLPHKLGEMKPAEVQSDEIVFLENTREVIAEKIRYKASRFLIFNGQVWRETLEPLYHVDVHDDKLCLKVVYFDIVNPGDFSALEKDEAIRFGEELYCRQNGTLQDLRYDLSEQIDVYSPQYLKRYPHAAKADILAETKSKQNWVCVMSYLFGYYMAKGMLRDSSVLCSLSNFIKEVDNWVAEYEGEMLEHDSIDEFLDGKLVDIGWKDLVGCTDNTEIWYTYRDASNYKLHTTVVIPGIVSDAQEKTIRDCLMDNEWFLPAQVGLPDDNKYSGTEDDHPFFELCSFETVSKPVTKGFENLTPEILVERFLKAKDNWDESSFA